MASETILVLKKRLLPSSKLGPVDVQREAMIAAARWMVAV